MDKIIEQGISGIIGNISSIYKEVKEEWNYASGEKINRYLDSFWKKNREIKTLLHGNNPKPFYEIYYPLTISLNEKRFKKYNAKSIFSQRNAFIVTADAGSGKSMLIKHLFNNCIELSYGIPFNIELRYLNDGDYSLEDYIANQIKVHITESLRVKERLFQKGFFIFFLDGYDEVKKDLKQKLIHSIRALCDKHPNIKIMISSRPYTNIEMLQNFVNIKIRPLTNDEVVEFIKKQIQDEELAKKIVKSIEESKKTNISSFLQNPLLLTLYILTYQNSSEIPAKVSLFYRRVVDSLFIEHDSKTKTGFQRERISNITFDKFEDVMKKFSIVSFFEDKPAFDIDYARNLLRKVIQNDCNCSFTPDELIEDLKLSFSFWIEDSGSISYAHKSLQEYFASLYIKDLDQTTKTVCITN